MDSTYPYEPGAKGLTIATHGTSADAAEAMAPSRKRLHLIALHTLHELGAAAPFEAVAVSGVKGAAQQPRFSELISTGMIEPTGERRRNPDTGKSAAVLRLTEMARERLSGGGL